MDDREKSERIKHLYDSLLGSSPNNTVEETRRIYKELISYGEPVSSIIGTIEMSGLKARARQATEAGEASAKPEEAAPSPAPADRSRPVTGQAGLAEAAGDPDGDVDDVDASDIGFWTSERPVELTAFQTASRPRKFGIRGVLVIAASFCALLGLTEFLTMQWADGGAAAAPGLSAPSDQPAASAVVTPSTAAVSTPPASSSAEPMTPKPDPQATAAVPDMPLAKVVTAAVSPAPASTADVAVSAHGPDLQAVTGTPETLPVKEAATEAVPAPAALASGTDATAPGAEAQATAAVIDTQPAKNAATDTERVTAALSSVEMAAPKGAPPVSALDKAPERAATVPPPITDPLSPAGTVEAIPSGPSDKPAVAKAGLSAAETAILIQRGDGLFAAGDIATARLFYERAANGGDATGALRLGETYDSLFLIRVGLSGMRGDPHTAVRWYRRAGELGSADADIVLRNVQNR